MISRDLNDDSSDSNLDLYEFRHRSPDVRLPETPNAEIVTVDKTYYFSKRESYLDEQNTDDNSDSWSAFDERKKSSFSLRSSRSELLCSLDLEQPASDRELLSDSESKYSALDRNLRPALSNLELNRSINDEEMWPSSIWKEWWSSNSAPIVFDADDKQIFSFDEEQNMVSLSKEEEDIKITMVCIEVAECNDVDVIEAVAKLPAIKRRSFLSELGRRVLSVGRELFCCGGTERDHRKMGKKTKWKYYPCTGFRSELHDDQQNTYIAAPLVDDILDLEMTRSSPCWY